MRYGEVSSNGLRVRRRDKRVWFVVLGIFVSVFLFSFLVQRFKNDGEAGAASLAGFDPGYIISDYQMGNYNSMSEAEIQNFLTSKNPCNNRDYSLYLRLSSNKNYTWHFENGHFVCLSEERFGDNDNEIGFQYGETAAHIIWQTAQDYRINPQVLLVLLQKETSLITDSIPNNGDYRKATGYGCPDTAACSSKYYGFKNQVRNAAALFRTVLDGGWTNYPLGNNYVQYNPNAACGGSVVNIRSLATSALYRYTPYQPNAGALAAGYGTASCGAYGNRNFYLYFEDWFGGILNNSKILEPRNVVARMEDSKLVILWDEPANAKEFNDVKYEVVVADNSRKERKMMVDGGDRQCSFDDLSDGLYIAASVKAISGDKSAYSRITFEYLVGSKLEAPIGLRVEKKNGGINVAWEQSFSDAEIVSKYEVVLADIDKKVFVKEVSGNDRSVIFYGLPMNEYCAASVKAYSGNENKYSRITFSIKTYGELTNNNNIYTGFNDMPSDEISKTAVSWAVNNGITDKNQFFNGEDALTRRQAMVLLWRISGKPDVELYTGFNDMPSDEISKTAVSWAVNNGITDKNQFFNGEDALTRRQAMVLLWRLWSLLFAAD